ncbi:Helicase associated domain protein [Streptomyces sp. NPDC127063]|uniref:Helicase associated domain protein n=1 Tax=Streptomyces sp. NPDC127063 TaxID=3347123 RepID=UPI003664A5E7
MPQSDDSRSAHPIPAGTGHERHPATARTSGPTMTAGAAGRVAPLHTELTLSFLARVAARYHLRLRDLLIAVTDTGSRRNTASTLNPDSEILLNAPARARLATLCGTAPAVLERALPAWTREEPRGPYRLGAAGRLVHGEEAVAAWGPACPSCTAARTGRAEPARRYLTPDQRVCPRHQFWLLFVPATSGLPVPLGGCPEIIHAHRSHTRLLHRSPVGAQAFDVARAVTGTWWLQPWPREECLWPARLEASMPKGSDPDWWKTAARDLVTYPETVALAHLLASRRLQQHLLAASGGHLPHRLGEMGDLLSELADTLARPWLARHLAADTHGALFTWAHSCIRTRAATTPTAQLLLWKVHAPHRPRPLTDLLAPPLPADPGKPIPRPSLQRGYSLRNERAFAQGLAHARTYYQQHQHLAVATHDALGGFPLGQWLTNRRTTHTRMPPHQAAALTALYPWWNAPWSLQWQRIWHQAHHHSTTRGPLHPAAGFPTTSYNLGEWLYLQCVAYTTLHPEQQRLMTEIGIDAPAAATARPRRRNLKAGAEQALAHARSYAAEHGSLASVTSTTVHEGFRLGQWLASQRTRQRTGHRPLPGGRAQALAAIDPWWCPPWHLKWQRHYNDARDATAGHCLQAEGGLEKLDDLSAATWLRHQCATYDELSEQQRQLLAAIGVTPQVARTASNHARTVPKRPTEPPTPDVEDNAGHARTAADPAALSGRPDTCPATEPKHPPAAPSRLGHHPDQRPGFETALAHARAWHAEHGHLAVPRDTRHDGYPLGMWLFSQRNRAKQRARASLPPSPHLSELAAIDPWWNPPWDLHWQRNYYRARDHVEAGKPFAPDTLTPSPSTALGSWATRVCLQYDQLHPDQQHLLTLIGITSEVAHARTRRAHPWRTAVEHAQAFAAVHGHLAAPHNTVHNGFALGQWLNKQRYRARRKGPHPAARALAAIDPWWNPPWGMTWQHAYQRARNHPHTPAARRWIHKQQRRWPLLHPDQQHLLTTASLVAT